MEELSAMTETPLEEVKQLTSMEVMDETEKAKFRGDVLSDPKKIKLIRAHLKKQKQALDMKLILVDKMFPNIEDQDERAVAINEKRLEYLTEHAQIEVALFTTRKNGFYMQSSSYSFEPHVGLNRRHRRFSMKNIKAPVTNITPKKKKRK